MNQFIIPLLLLRVINIWYFLFDGEAFWQFRQKLLEGGELEVIGLQGWKNDDLNFNDKGEMEISRLKGAL